MDSRSSPKTMTSANAVSCKGFHPRWCGFVSVTAAPPMLKKLSAPMSPRSRHSGRIHKRLYLYSAESRQLGQRAWLNNKAWETAKVLLAWKCARRARSTRGPARCTSLASRRSGRFRPQASPRASPTRGWAQRSTPAGTGRATTCERRSKSVRRPLHRYERSFVGHLPWRSSSLGERSRAHGPRWAGSVAEEFGPPAVSPIPPIEDSADPVS